MQFRITRLLFAGVLLLFALSLPEHLNAQATPAQSLLVLSKHDHAPAIVDPSYVDTSYETLSTKLPSGFLSLFAALRPKYQAVK